MTASLKMVTHKSLDATKGENVKLKIGNMLIVLYAFLFLMASSVEAFATPAGLVSWWKAEGNANDWVGGNNGTLMNGASFSTGAIGQAFSFDGVDDFVSFPSSPSLNVQSFTLAAWVYPTATHSMPIFEWNDGSGTAYGLHFWLYPDGTSLGLNNYNGSYAPVIASDVVTLNAWNYVAATYDQPSGQTRIFINGVPVADANHGSITSLTTADLYLGSRIAGVENNKFEGMIDEPVIFNRALSATEIQGIYNAGSAGMRATADVPKTGQTTKYTSGDDGDLQIGMPWPEPRFTVASSGTGTVVIDGLTGLMWPQNMGELNGYMTWQASLDYIAYLNGINYLGHNDWRLPNINELKSLVNLGKSSSRGWLTTQGFKAPHGSFFWSSTTDAGNANKAWIVLMEDSENGGAFSDDKGNVNFPWPVRGGQGDYASLINLPKTGQTASYSAGDDGGFQMGSASPIQRFTQMSAEGGMVVLDQLTGLVWTQDGNSVGNETCDSAASSSALGHVACLNATSFLGYNDWRLPNRMELESLINYGQTNTASWLNSQGFTNVQASVYNSSTIDSANTLFAWYVNMFDGYLGFTYKFYRYNTWPVRGGQSGSFAHLTVSKSGTGFGAVSTSRGSLIWSGPNGAATIGSNVSVTLTATPDSGSLFSGWSGDADCSDGEVLMTTDKDCTANFVLITPATGVTLTPNSASPRLAGNNDITFTAVGIGVTGNYEYKFWFKKNGVWNMVRDYSTTPTWTWNTIGAPAGTYDIMVHARNVGSIASFETARSYNYILVANPPATGVTLIPDIKTPQLIGNSTISFTAGGSGGSGNYEYKFWLRTGGVWNSVQEYTTTNTWTWNTNGAPAGSYEVEVYIRNVGSIAPHEAFNSITYVLVADMPANGATLAPSMPSPQLTGNNNIIFTAGGTGGSGNYEYRFWLKSNGVWSQVQAYSTANTWTWNTAGAGAGTYGVQVYVRNIGSSAKSEAVKNISFILNATGPVIGATLVPNIASPQAAGSNVIFTANGIGGSGNYEYKFWIKAAGVWTAVQGYSSTSTFTWDTSGLTPGTYRAEVYVRNIGSSAKYEAVLGMGYVIK